MFYVYINFRINQSNAPQEPATGRAARESGAQDQAADQQLQPDHEGKLNRYMFIERWIDRWYMEDRQIDR